MNEFVWHPFYMMAWKIILTWLRPNHELYKSIHVLMPGPTSMSQMSVKMHVIWPDDMLPTVSRSSRMLNKSASREKAEVQATVEDKIKNIRPSLNLDLKLSLVHSLRTSEVLVCPHSFSAAY